MAGDTADTLLGAVRNNDVDCVKTIVENVKNSLNPDIVFDALHLAVSKQLVPIVEILVGITGQEINRCDEKGHSLLFIAMMKGNQNLLISLLKGRPDVNHRVKNDKSLLHYAASKSWLRGRFSAKGLEFINTFASTCTQILIDSGADLSQLDSNNFTPIQVAVEEDNFEAVKILLKHNAKLECGPSMGCPLHFAVRRQSKELIRVLVKSGVSLGIKNDCGDTPLHLALKCKLANMVAFLIEVGENVSEALNMLNSKGETVLHIVTKYGCLGIIKALLAKGSDPNIQDSYGYTALMYAITSIPTMSQYHWTLPQKKSRICQLCAVCELLINYKADVRICNTYGRSSFEEALHCGKLCVLNVFLKSYTDVNHLNRILFSSMNYCNRSRLTLYVIQLLVDSGADVNARRAGDGFTMLHKAVVDVSFYSYDFKCILNIINFLISCGADVNAIDNDKKTPLHIALDLNNNKEMMLPEVVKILLENGANVFATDCGGEKPVNLVQYLYTDNAQDIKDVVFYFTLLYLAAYWPCQDSPEIVELAQDHLIDNLLSLVLLNSSNSKRDFLRLLNEVYNMKITIVDNVSLYDLLIANSSTILEYLNNDFNVDKLESSDLFCNCSSYASIIKAKVKRALKIQQKQNILDSGNAFMVMISNKFNIPCGPLVDCSDAMFKYLCFQDLKNLRCVVDDYFS